MALALASIMAAGVFSVIAASAKRLKKYAASLSAVRILNNIIECFKCDDFSSALAFYIGEDVSLAYETDGDGNVACAACALYFDIGGNYSADEGELKANVKITESTSSFYGEGVYKRVLEAAVFYGGDELVGGAYAKRAEETL